MAAFNINIKKISQPQIGGGGDGGRCMSLACKYFMAMFQEFDGVNCTVDGFRYISNIISQSNI